MDSVSTIRDTLRVALVEDEGLLRDLVRQVLSRQPGIEVVGDFADAAAAEQGLAALAPDVVLLDIDLGAGLNGVQLGIALRGQLPKVGLVLLSNHRDPSWLQAVPAEQADGWSYLHKRSVADAATLVRAIRGAAEGLVVLDAQLAKQLMGSRRAVDQLTERMRQLLELVAQGFSNQAIAERLHLAEKTVENQLGQLYRTLGIDSHDPAGHARVQATLHYLRRPGA